jgi:hypothetical protein
MNILEQEDIIKGLPDQALMQEAQRPSGELPQYLVVSEIQRRSDMRKRYKAEQEQMPQGTVKDKVMQEGIMASMPPQMAMAPQMAQRMPNMPPPQMPPQGIEQAMPPQMMSGGGIVRMANGGRAQEILDLVAVGLSPLQITQRGYEEKEITAAMGEYNRRMASTADPTFDGSSRIVGATEREDPTYQRRATGFLDDPGAIGDVVSKGVSAVVEPIGSAAEYVSEIPGRIAQSARMADAKNPLSDSLLLASDLGGDGISRPARTRRDVRAIPPDRNLNELEQYLEDTFTKPFLGSGIETSGRMGRASELKDRRGDSFSERLVSGITNFFEDGFAGPIVAPGGIANVGTPRMDALRKESGSEAEEERVVARVPTTYLGYLAPDDSEFAPSNTGEDSASDADADSAGNDSPAINTTTKPAGGMNLEGGGKEVQSESVFNADDYRSRLEYLMGLGVDSDKEVEIPTLDYSDIRADLDRRTKSNMLFRLAEGIGKGDVASGIGGMSKVAEEAARDISKIDIAERKGQFDAATAAQKRQDSLIKTQRMLGAELMGLDAKLRVSSDTDKREILRAYSGIRDGLQDQLVALTASGYGQTLPKSSQDLMNRIDKMLQNLANQYGIVLPPADEGGADLNDPANINDITPSRQAAP